MIIVFNCPGCGNTLRMKEQYGGQRGRCPHCQGAIMVPAIETEAGMDLLPLEGPAPSPPSPTPTAPSFSLGSRLPPSGTTSPGPTSAGAPSLGGDSNIGLAPMEDIRAKPTPAPSAPVTTSSGAKAPGPSSSILGLAPLEESFAKQTTPKPAPAPTAAASQAGDSDLSLAPLEGSAASAAKTASATAPKPVATNAAAAKPAANVDEIQRIVCAKCGTKMRLPPNATGKQIVCPKCKSKQRVPEAVAAATEDSKKTLSNLDTIALTDTPPAQDLGGGMFDMLDEGAGEAAGAGSTSPAALSATKLSGGKSKSGNKLLGMPPMAVYGGAAAVTALVIGLILVMVLSGPTASTTIVAQAPTSVPNGPGPSTPTPPVSTPPTSPPSTASVAPTPGASVTSTTPSEPPIAPPTIPPIEATASGPAAAPTGQGMGPLAAAAARRQAEMAAQAGAPSSTGAGPLPLGGRQPPVPTSAQTPAQADPANWRQRVPLVRLLPDTQPAAGEAPAAQKSRDELLSLVKKVQAVQTQLQECLGQINDTDAAKRMASQWADMTSQGLDDVRQIRQAGGLPKVDPAQPPSAGTGLLGAAMAQEKAKLANPGPHDQEATQRLEAELTRINQFPGAMTTLETALGERAAREPQGALAAALAQRGVTIHAAPAP
jgi:DNA-directed RNA polymerase subunit RPC12/RpoP